MKLTPRDIIHILNKEIKWCLDNPDEAFHPEYRKGFTNGLIQAKYLIGEFYKMIQDEEPTKEEIEEIQRYVDLPNT